MTKIEWTHGLNGRVGRTWNPVAGCTVISPGCTNCYAMRMAARINKMTPGSHYEGLTKIVNGNPVWTGKIAKSPDHIFNAPLGWKKPSLVFVNSMSDLFHDDMPDEWISRVFDIIEKTPQHIYQILTKRADNMRWYFQNRFAGEIPENAWLGVSVENQALADRRIPLLLDTPAAVRFISAEPLLGPLDLEPYLLQPSKWGGGWLNNYPYRYPKQPLSWVVIGGESGPGRRQVDLAWMRSIRDQCKAAGVPLFVKQIDKKIPIPEDLMIRQWPEGVSNP